MGETKDETRNKNYVRPHSPKKLKTKIPKNPFAVAFTQKIKHINHNIAFHSEFPFEGSIGSPFPSIHFSFGRGFFIESMGSNIPTSPVQFLRSPTTSEREIADGSSKMANWVAPVIATSLGSLYSSHPSENTIYDIPGSSKSSLA